LRLWKCGIDIGNGPYYPPSLSSANTSNHDNNNNDPIHEKVLPPIAATIQFLDIEREEGEKKEVQENNDNNNNSSTIDDLSNDTCQHHKKLRKLSKVVSFFSSIL
jgi:hypothetical protein